jgi:magnesium transporter
MQPALRLPIPSRSLLRFLKYQSDAAFLSHGTADGSLAAGARVCRRERTPIRSNVIGARPLTTSSRQRQACPGHRAVGHVRNGPPTKLTQLGFCTTAAPRKLFEPKPDAEPTWQERLWGTNAKKGPKLLKPEDLPGHDELDHGSSMFTSRRALAAKAALEPRLRCTEVDESGKVILVDGEFKKTELIAKVYSRFATRDSNTWLTLQPKVWAQPPGSPKD